MTLVEAMAWSDFDGNGLLPVSAAVHNVREVYKHLVLLEDHLLHPEKRCTDCIVKHFLTIEALVEEALGLDGASEVVLDGWASRVRNLGSSVLSGRTDPVDAAGLLRQWRKELRDFLL